MTEPDWFVIPKYRKGAWQDSCNHCEGDIALDITVPDAVAKCPKCHWLHLWDDYLQSWMAVDEYTE